MRPAAALAAALVLAANAALATPALGASVIPCLCGSNPVNITLPEQCSTQNLKPAPMPPCCRLKDEVLTPCQIPVPAGASKCRTVQVNRPACPSSTPDFCNTELMTLNISLSFQELNETCCHSCTCYGDPHCIGFNGKNDTWVICDARVIKPKTGNQICTLSKSMCLQQYDNLGNPCIWKAPQPHHKWNLGINGSECVFSNPKEPPTMVMYQADSFSLNLVMGERAIIQGLWITDVDSGPGYYLTAANCYTYATGQPWRDSFQATQAPSNPAWAPNNPNQFSSTILDNGGSYGPGLTTYDVLWEIVNLPSQISMSIRCTRTVELINGQLQYSAPRINIDELREPLDYMTQRKNVGGFCPNGTIAKEGSTANTNYLESIGACQTQSQDLDIAKVLCSGGTSQAGVAGCQLDWCKATIDDWQDCVSDITKYGWAQTYCAAHTVISQRASQCTPSLSASCTQCVNDINDYGFQYAYSQFDQLHPASPTCTPKNQLPPYLQNCQPGVNIQYLVGSTWVTYLGVPADVTLCNNMVNFDSVNDPALFQYPVRIEQCSVDESCLQDECKPTFGFTVDFLFNYKAAPAMCPCTKSPVSG